MKLDFINIIKTKRACMFSGVHAIGLLLIFALFGTACEDTWDDHYALADNTVNESMWEKIQQESKYETFVTHVKAFGLDSIILKSQSTLFIPDNEAFAALTDSVDITPQIISYLVSPSIFSFRNIENNKKLLTLSGKFALLENVNGIFFIDDIDITFSSPLYLDGRYYEVNAVPVAKPNIQEYIKNKLPDLFAYINEQEYDSLDKKNSIPIDFDENGNTIYDSVFITIDQFNNKYFPIEQESKEKFATFVLYTAEQYKSSLNEMAANLGGSIQSYTDIPQSWIESVLYPITMENGCFQGVLGLEELYSKPLLNINGVEVRLDAANIDESNRVLCSNGLIYHFKDYHIADSLYAGESRVEGEALIDSIAPNSFLWKQTTQTSGTIVVPSKSYSAQASEGGSLSVLLGRSFEGEFGIEFNIKNIFPRKYMLVWRANFRPSGLYAISVNGEVITEFDTFLLRYTIPSITGKKNRPSPDGYNQMEFWVENITEYGDVNIKFEYIEQGNGTDNGFSIDYIALIPAPSE